MRVPAQRLDLALRDGATFEAWIEYYSEKSKLARSGGLWRVQALHLGRLPVPSGVLIAGDAGLQFDMTGPFARAIAPGEYDVWATMAMPERRRWWPFTRPRPDDLGDWPRVAFLTLLLTPEHPKHYEPALLQKAGGQRPIAGHAGFGIDSAEAALMDASQLPSVRRVNDGMAMWNLAGKAAFGPPGIRGLAAVVDLPTDPPVPAAVCCSGWGDGAYLSYWGLNDAGDPVRLVIDFDLPREARG